MGQATLDLPDPLEPAVAAPATPAAADDLLAQLAGDEIDRLLAEAEVEQGENPLAAQAAATTRSPAENAAFDAALKAANQSPKNDAPVMAGNETLPVVASPTAPAPAAQTLNQQMQQVFAGIGPTPAPSIDAPTATRVVDAIVIDTQCAPAAMSLQPQADAELTPVFVAPVDGGMSLAERDGLRAGEIEALTADPLGELEEPEEDAPVPLVLKPLVWINAPFAAVPEGVRAALGKVAIVTLVNAVGVLAYVLIFRKH